MVSASDRSTAVTNGTDVATYDNESIITRRQS